MKQDKLDELLAALGRKPMPACPPDLESSVWRAIRFRKVVPRDSAAVLDYLADMIWQAKVLACSALTAVTVGALIAVSLQATEPDPTAGALGLRVFSADAPALPSTLLTH